MMFPYIQNNNNLVIIISVFFFPPNFWQLKPFKISSFLKKIRISPVKYKTKKAVATDIPTNVPAMPFQTYLLTHLQTSSEIMQTPTRPSCRLKEKAKYKFAFSPNSQRHSERERRARAREKTLCVESEKERSCVVRAGQKFSLLCR
jgi:hypothetical protein